MEYNDLHGRVRETVKRGQRVRVKLKDGTERTGTIHRFGARYVLGLHPAARVIFRPSPPEVGAKWVKVSDLEVIGDE